VGAYNIISRWAHWIGHEIGKEIIRVNEAGSDCFFLSRYKILWNLMIWNKLMLAATVVIGLFA